jgi:hypothetical protein
VCQELRESVILSLQKATEEEREDKEYKDMTIEDRPDSGQIILSKEEDRSKIKLLLEKALYEEARSIKSSEDYLVAENEEDPNEIAILKKGDIQQLGLFICGFCPMIFRSEIEKNIHQRIHYIGFG